MKKVIKTIACAAVALTMVSAFAGCDVGGDMLTGEPNVGISAGVSESIGNYSKVAYYEMERPDDVKFTFETDKIQKVSFKYRVLGSKEYSLRNDVLTVNRGVFENETAGDKRLRVFVDDMYTELTVRVVTKVIYNTEDFNSIRTNLNGVYVLGADVDFGNQEFWPIGKPVKSGDSTGNFEGILDGMGYSVKNIVLNAVDKKGDNHHWQTGPSTGDEWNYAVDEEGNLIQAKNDDGSLKFDADGKPVWKDEDTVQSNGANYNVGIFASTGGSAQIINTDFANITVNCQGLGGAVVGANGGLVKNCRVSCKLYSRGACEKAAGIAGTNGSSDAAGRIENCIVHYTYGSGTPRGIADWNVGVIKNCYACAADNFVYYPDYNYETKQRDPDFNYNTYLNESNWTEWIYTNYSLPAFPGTVDTSLWKFYPSGEIINSEVVTKDFLLNPANFTEENGWDTDIWNFTYGAFPTLKIQSR